jgi:tetratricopeptide (TPR) repeat protein
MRSREILLAFSAYALLDFASAWADGAGAYRRPPSSPPPAVQAQDAYKAGVALIEAAAREEKATENQSDARSASKATARAKKAYTRALSQFNTALRVDPAMYEALTYVGFANRKLGRYEQALKAYDDALRLQPGFAPAIEYQGEALLGLNRIDDAKLNYFRLYATAPDQADKLLMAMSRWAEQRRADPQGMDAVSVDAFAKWVEERAALKTTTQPSGSTATGW